MESLSYKNFYLDVKGKDIYFIWVWLKSRKAELKQLKQISQNMLACLVVRLQLQLKIYLHKHKTTFFSEFQRIKTTSKHSTVVFKFQLLHPQYFQLKLFAREVRQKQVNSPHCRWILETIIRFKIVRWRTQKHVSLLTLRIWLRDCFTVDVHLIF